jgi:hypothetical protein
LRQIMRSLVGWCWKEKLRYSEEKTCPIDVSSTTWRICSCHTDFGTGFSRIISVFYCQYHSTNALHQRFSNFLKVGTTFISQNVLRTTLLLNVLSVC